jgi:hypothetical protein
MEWRKASQRLSCYLLLAAAALPLAAISPAPTAKTCDALREWARDNRDDLPRDYRGLLAFQLDERRAIYTQLSAEEKAAFWSDRLGVYVQEHPELTAGQLGAISEARAFLQADFYEAEKPGTPAGALGEAERGLFADRMHALLGETVARDLLYGLGPEAPGQNAVESTDATCECRRVVECSVGYCKSPSAPPCTQTVSGCGIGGNLPCTGMCTLAR